MRSKSLFLLLITFAACKSVDKPIEAEIAESNLVTKEITYDADGITMKGYLAYTGDLNEKKPGVLVVHEWWGHNGYARMRAEKLAMLGYVALAIDMYGDGKQASHPSDAGMFAGEVFENMEGAKARFNKAYEVLATQPNVDKTEMAAVGYCFGGSIAMSMANAGADLKGVAAFHSGITLPIQPQTNVTKAKFLVCNGADDPFLDSADVARFQFVMDSVSVPLQYISYEGAVHAFTNPDADSMGKAFNLPLAYNEKADKESWSTLVAFLKEIFSKG